MGAVLLVYVFATYHLLTPPGETDLLNFLTALKHKYWNFIVMASSLYVGTSMLELVLYLTLEIVSY